MVKGAIPFKFVEKALIVTLPVHTDWVCKIAYEPSLAALVSGSLDSTLQVTQLDWPPVGRGEAPTTAAEKEELEQKLGEAATEQSADSGWDASSGGGGWDASSGGGWGRGSGGGWGSDSVAASSALSLIHI